MSVKYFVSFKDKKSRGSDVTSGHGKKLNFCLYFYFFPFFLLRDSKIQFRVFLP